MRTVKETLQCDSESALSISLSFRMHAHFINTVLIVVHGRGQLVYRERGHSAEIIAASVLMDFSSS